MTAPCAIWGTPAELPKDSDGDYIYYDSARAGGRYRVTGTATQLLKNSKDQEKALLTTWLCNQRQAGEEYPGITSDIVNDLRNESPLTTGSRIERALLQFNRSIRVGGAIPITAQGRPGEKDAEMLAAVTESHNHGELGALLSVMEQMGLLQDLTQAIGAYRYTPTASGWLKIDELAARLPSATQAFVAMWFNDATERSYVAGIEPAIKDSGYQAVRIDKKEHSNKIDDEIIAEIRRSKFLVADFTCEPEKVRGGVYFEAGYAMGRNIPVIWMCAKQSLKDVHFDTRQYNHIVWETPEGLRQALKARIGAVIGDGPLS